MIIDYHSHIDWDRKTDTYDVEGLLKDMEENNISKRVVSALHGSSIRSQNKFIKGLVDKYPETLIGSAVIDPKQVDCLGELHTIGKSGSFKCIELDSLEHNYYPNDIDCMDEIFELAKEYDLIVNVFTGWGPRTMPEHWAYYAKRHPEVIVVVLHMGTTDFGYGTVRLIPEIENMYVETSGMYEFPILRRAFTNINHDKFLFGSHFPDKLTTNSIHTFDLLNLEEELKEKLYYLNAKRILKI